MKTAKILMIAHLAALFLFMCKHENIYIQLLVGVTGTLFGVYCTIMVFKGIRTEQKRIADELTKSFKDHEAN